MAEFCWPVFSAEKYSATQKPLKTAGLFGSFIILLLSIEVGDSVIDDQTAEYLRLSRVLKGQGLAAEQIGLYRCGMNNRALTAVSLSGIDVNMWKKRADTSTEEIVSGFENCPFLLFIML